MKCKIEITQDDGKIVTYEGTPIKFTVENISIVEKPNYKLGIMEHEVKKPIMLRYEINLELGEK